MAIDRESVLLSTQRALVGAITKNMKAITIGFTDTSYTLKVYFNSEPNEEELEIMKIVTGEVCADIGEFTEFKEEAEVANSNVQVNHLEKLDVWVFMEHFH